MKTAKKPMILAGAGAWKATEAIEGLSKHGEQVLLQASVEKGLFEEATPYLLQGIGEGGNPHASKVFKDADVVLLAGVSWWPEGYVPEKRESFKLIHI